MEAKLKETLDYALMLLRDTKEPLSFLELEKVFRVGSVKHYTTIRLINNLQNQGLITYERGSFSVTDEGWEFNSFLLLSDSEIEAKRIRYLNCENQKDQNERRNIGLQKHLFGLAVAFVIGLTLGIIINLS